MAIMYPRRLTPAHVKSRAEQSVFRALETYLGDEWSVFHSVGLVYRDPKRGAVDDEVDFVLAHPEKGVIALEVKGGGLECHNGEWRRRSADGEPETIRDPIEQAIDHRYSLERKIKEVPGWNDHRLLIAYALALPDVTVEGLALAPDAPRELIVDRAQLRTEEDLIKALDRILRYRRGSGGTQTAPGPDGIEMLRELLAPEFVLSMRRVDEYADEEADMVRLTHGQVDVLRALEQNRRIVVRGCAGSGKTMLAVHRAHDLAEAGARVASVCFNQRLASDLAARFRHDNVDFSTIDSLFLRTANEAGIQLPAGYTTPQEEKLAAFEDAIAKLGGPYDAIFVDEAQDLRNDPFTALVLALRDEEQGRLLLFMDDNQRVYHTGFEVPEEFTQYELAVNCRNTQKIHEAVMRFHDGEAKPSVKGPLGRPPELVETADQARAVAERLERFKREEELPAQDMVVLSPHPEMSSRVFKELHPRLRPHEEIGGPSVLYDEPPVAFFSSINTFKGLEAKVVVLCELEDVQREKEQILRRAVPGVQRRHRRLRPRRSRAITVRARRVSGRSHRRCTGMAADGPTCRPRPSPSNSRPRPPGSARPRGRRREWSRRSCRSR